MDDFSTEQETHKDDDEEPLCEYTDPDSAAMPIFLVVVFFFFFFASNDEDENNQDRGDILSK
jgi:hypothetical protein